MEFNLTQRFSQMPSSLDRLQLLFRVEGDLMKIAALARLDIGNEPDEDGFSDNLWSMGAIAEALGKSVVLDLIPKDIQQRYVPEIVSLGRTICDAGWRYFYQRGLNDGRSTVAELNNLDM